MSYIRTRHFPIISAIGMVALLASVPVAAAGVAEIELDADRASFGYRAQLETAANGENSLRIVEILAPGAADEAGLRAGDQILAIDGWQPDVANDLDVVLAGNRFKAGATYRFTVRRGTDTFEVPMEGKPISAARLERLQQWVEIAAEKLGQGGLTYCDNEEQSNPEEAPSASTFWDQVVARARQQQADVVLRVSRPTSTPALLANAGDLGIVDRRIEPGDLFGRFSERAAELEPGESIGIRFSFEPGARGFNLRLVEGPG